MESFKYLFVMKRRAGAFLYVSKLSHIWPTIAGHLRFSLAAASSRRILYFSEPCCLRNNFFVYMINLHHHSVISNN